ncbi:MAG: hypothetical protein HOW73_48715 [Polyangiaceae bacterium]|nr:hypothetical protein [Polyangiaceae bacterium]
MLGASGCRVTQDDLHRWEGTEQGPVKLTSVVKHDKYDMPLRVEAAVSLIRMKPRKGRYEGIDKLVIAFDELQANEREPILAGLLPIINAELRKDPPAAQAGQPAPPDPSFAYKDAAYALFTYENEQLIVDPAQREELRASLKYWAMKDFDRRLENKAQKTSMEQLLQFLGPEGVDQLPEKITKDARNYEKIADLIDKIASKETKEAASAKLVEYTKYVLSKEWLDAKEPIVREGNAVRNITVTPEEFKGQLEAYQDEELQRALSAMKKVGGRPAVEFALDLGGNRDVKEDHRVWALAALELRIDPKNAKDVEKLFAIAMDDDKKTGGKVKDMAFSRIGEMEREQVIGKLYDTFTKATDWKVRRQAGSIILRMSEMKHLGEFMGKLPEKEAKGFAMGEATTYGDYFVDWKEGDIRKELEKYIGESATPAQRSVAFSFYLVRGEPKDLKMLEAFKADKGPLPSCETAEGCKWECYVPKDEKNPESEKELKEVKTIGEYVTHCVEPVIKFNAEQAKKQAEKKDAPPAPPGGSATPATSASSSAAPATSSSAAPKDSATPDGGKK